MTNTANTTGLYGLLGRKLGHSFSTEIHSELGNKSYKLIELEESELETFFKRRDIAGLNVTIPYKKTVMRYLDELTPEALAIGSVNTIVNHGGRLIGSNTDAAGFMYMAKKAGISFGGKKTLVFGSGGASLSAQYSAREAGASKVVVMSRNEKGEYSDLERNLDAEIIVNATPVGMYPDMSGRICDLSRFKKCVGALDLVYNPLRTEFILQAEALGIPNAGGMAMLVHQAKLAEELFANRAVDDSETERILSLIYAERENIVLIGMPGSGKSEIGRSLSEMTGRKLYDLDKMIEAAAKKSICRIFSEDGEAAFRQLETQTLATASKENGSVIVTGGGAVKAIGNLSLMRQNGRIYHVERDLDRLETCGRPLSLNADLAALYSERLPLYQSFRDDVVYNDSTPEEAAERIMKLHAENTRDRRS